VEKTATKASKGREEIKTTKAIRNWAVNSRGLRGSLWGITLGLARWRV